MTEVDEIIERVGSEEDRIVQILQAIQEKHRYLPAEALRRVTEITKITPARLYGVATFYSQFRLTPVGRYTIRVCHGTACYVRGAKLITEAIRKDLRIQEGSDTDPRRIFTVEEVACIGCCSLAPCMMIEDVTYGHLGPQNVAGAMKHFLKEHGD